VARELGLQARVEVRALTTAIRDFRPPDLYADDEARFRWFQLCNVAALAF
jgi:hypothetical protein